MFEGRSRSAPFPALLPNLPPTGTPIFVSLAGMLFPVLFVTLYVFREIFPADAKRGHGSSCGLRKGSDCDKRVSLPPSVVFPCKCTLYLNVLSA